MAKNPEGNDMVTLRCLVIFRRLLLIFFAVPAMMLLYGGPISCIAQTSSDDFLPLSVGNQWTYHYLAYSADYLLDRYENDSGSVSYSIVLKAEAADSLLWGFIEIRNIVSTVTSTWLTTSTFRDTITDTTGFLLIEYKKGNHRFVRNGNGNSNSVFWMTSELSDSSLYTRYHPEALADTFMTAVEAPSGHPYRLDTTFYRRYEGIVRSSYNSVHMAGGTAWSKYSLISASITSVGHDGPVQPEEFSLRQNFPNPFNPSTRMEYSVPSREHVMLSIFNALGQHVATLVDETKAAGTYTAVWNAARQASGIYYYQIRAGAYTQTKRMALIK